MTILCGKWKEMDESRKLSEGIKFVRGNGSWLYNSSFTQFTRVRQNEEPSQVELDSEILSEWRRWISMTRDRIRVVTPFGSLRTNSGCSHLRSFSRVVKNFKYLLLRLDTNLGRKKSNESTNFGITLSSSFILRAWNTWKKECSAVLSVDLVHKRVTLVRKYRRRKKKKVRGWCIRVADNFLHRSGDKQFWYTTLPPVTMRGSGIQIAVHETSFKSRWRDRYIGKSWCNVKNRCGEHDEFSKNKDTGDVRHRFRPALRGGPI